jgi:hypothetical protein
MITEKDCKMLVGCFCEALKSDTELQDVMAKAMLRGSKQKEHLISLSQAASILGVSKSLLYRIKDNFSCIKTGKAKTCRVMFEETKLLPEYEMYLAGKS